MPASNKLDLDARIRAALRAGPAGSKAYKASMQASYRYGTGKTKATKHTELRALVVTQKVREEKTARLKRERQEKRAAAAKRNFERKHTGNTAPSAWLYGPMRRELQGDEIEIQLVADRVEDTPENRTSEVERARALWEAEDVQDALTGSVRVIYAAVSVQPAGDYPKYDFIPPEMRGKEGEYDKTHYDAHLFTEVWAAVTSG